MFSAPPLMVEKYSGEIKSIKEYAENLTYYESRTNSSSNNTFVLNEECLVDLKKFIQDSILQYTTKVFQTDHPFVITQSWITKNTSDSMQEIHSHPGSIISGVFYIDCPENSGCIEFNRGQSTFEIQINKDCCNQWMSDRYVMTPQPGNLFLFPSNLLHSVKKNESNQTRYSLAFNSFPMLPVGDIDFLTYLY